MDGCYCENCGVILIRSGKADNDDSWTVDLCTVCSAAILSIDSQKA